MSAENSTTYDGWALGGQATMFDTTTDPVHLNPGGINNGFYQSAGSPRRRGQLRHGRWFRALPSRHDRLGKQ